MNKFAANLLSSQRYVFWDFDGVIKDSVEVKSAAFEKLFASFGRDVVKKVRSHHEANGGMSRFDKLPIYIKWSGQPVSQALIDEYSQRFSVLVKQHVIESEWVPGVVDYLYDNFKNQVFFLVTATPQSEIEEILDTLKINHLFRKVIGAPTRKGVAIKLLLTEYLISIKETVMIGDSNSDCEAARVNNVPFILRRTNLNKILQEKVSCPMIDDFSNE
jgi:phosphoglycolate phosphatase-like HAD superfamily hydrolase